MKKLVFIFSLFLACLSNSNGQTVVNDTTAVNLSTMPPIKASEPTGRFLQVGPDNAGKFRYYPIMRGPKGGYYVERTSKAGEVYRQYLRKEEIEK